MLICIDLSALYFAIRDMGVTINYERFLNELRKTFGDNSEIHCFTIANSKNVSQQKFLAKLGQLGVKLHVYPSNTPPNFTAEIATWCALSGKDRAVIVSNDQSLIRPFEMLKVAGKTMVLSFFSEKIQGAWMPLVFSREVEFFDLSSPEVKNKISE